MGAVLRSRLSLLHGIERRDPRWLLAALGLPLLVGGVLLITRPLSALSVIALLIGVSAIVTGVAELVTAHRRPAVLRFAAGIAWVLGGALAIVWLGRSIELLPVAVCVLLVAGAVASLGGVTRGRLGERVLAGALALAQLSFAVLALVWPDATLLVIAVLFGVRVALHHGLALLLRAVRGAPRAPRRLRAALPWAMPLLVAWGDRDQVIAPELQHDYVAQLCADGTDFSWSEMPGDDHLAIVQDSAFLDPLMQWTEDRFAGADAPAPDC